MSVKRYLLVLFIAYQNVLGQTFIEPFLGHERAEIEGNSVNEADLSGTTVGFRFGQELIDSFSVGLDYSLGHFNYERDIDGLEFDYKTQETGIFASYDFPLLFRIYATYIPLYYADWTGHGEIEETITGRGFKLGIGHSILPYLMLNLEYKDIQFSKVKTSSGSRDVKSGSSKGTALLISAPFSL